MKEGAIARNFFDRMTDRMSVIQNRSQPALAFVVANNVGFDLARSGNELLQKPGVTRKHVCGLDLQPVE